MFCFVWFRNCEKWGDGRSVREGIGHTFQRPLAAAKHNIHISTVSVDELRGCCTAFNTTWKCDSRSQRRKRETKKERKHQQTTTNTTLSTREKSTTETTDSLSLVPPTAARVERGPCPRQAGQAGAADILHTRRDTMAAGYLRRRGGVVSVNGESARRNIADGQQQKQIGRRGRRSRLRGESE